jgi:hypothetical protein
VCFHNCAPIARSHRAHRTAPNVVICTYSAPSTTLLLHLDANPRSPRHNTRGVRVRFAHSWMRNVKVVVTGRLWSVNQTNPSIAPGQTHLMRVHLTSTPTLTGTGTLNPAGCRVIESGHLVSILELRVSAPGFGRRKMPLVLQVHSLAVPFTFLSCCAPGLNLTHSLTVPFTFLSCCVRLD